jgi:ferric-chelate reductase (NADPH)
MKSEVSGAGPGTPAGRLTTLLTKWFFRQATVSRVEVLSEHFRLITLAGARLKDVEWAPGQKIQIAVGGGANRTYTPFSWDAVSGETRILAFSHGEGPGSVWASAARAGDGCQFSGPRRSLDLSDLGERTFLFGDETSFGLARALGTSMGPSGNAVFLFEASSVGASEPVWRALGIQDATFVQRAEADTHLGEIEAQVLKIIDEWAPTSFVLSGKASSIQRISRLLKSRGIVSSRLRAVVYWAPGRKGLD